MIIVVVVVVMIVAAMTSLQRFGHETEELAIDAREFASKTSLKIIIKKFNNRSNYILITDKIRLTLQNP